MRLLRRLLFLVLLGSGFAAELATPPATGVSDSGFAYFRPADFERPLVSPNGGSVGFIARLDQHAKLYRLDLATGKVDGVFDPGEGDIESFWWISDTRVLISGYGTGELVYFTYDLATKQKKNLPVLGERRASRIRFYPRFENRIVFGLSETTDVERNGSFNSDYLTALDLDTGRLKRIGSIRGAFEHVILSSQGEIRAQTWAQGMTWHVEWRESAKSPWQEIKGSNSFPTFFPVSMDADDRHLVVVAFDQGDTSALMRLDPATGQRTLIAQKGAQDILYVLTPTASEEVFAATFYSMEAEDVAFLDPATADFHRKLQNSLPGKSTRILNSSGDRQVQVVANWDPLQPPTYYLFARGQLSQLGRERDALKADKLGRFMAFSFNARDGLAERGYVLLPTKADGPCPLVVMAPAFIGDSAPRGLDYDAAAQYLASRGYAVAQFVTRGQRGFGRKFEEAGNFTLSDRVVEDLEDGIKHLVGQKIADPARVAIYGSDDRALFALHAAGAGSPYSAVIVEDPSRNPTATKIGWESNQLARASEIFKQIGGVEVATRMMHKFSTTVTVPALQVPVMLVGFRTGQTLDVEDLLRKTNKVFETRQPVWLAKGDSNEAYRFRIWRDIADFLDRHFRPSTGK